jgi:hypothetical protein
MKTKDDGGPAFPQTPWRDYYESTADDGSPYHEEHEGGPGMSLRDWFAATASDADVEAFLYSRACMSIVDERIEARYRFADDMLAERSKQETER